MGKREIEPDMPKIGHILKNSREKSGYTTDQVAEWVGLETRSIQAIENDEWYPKFRAMYRWIHSLNISADEIFYPGVYEDDEIKEVSRMYQDLDEHSKTLVRFIMQKMLETKDN